MNPKLLINFFCSIYCKKSNLTNIFKIFLKSIIRGEKYIKNSQRLRNIIKSHNYPVYFYNCLMKEIRVQTNVELRNAIQMFMDQSINIKMNKIKSFFKAVLFMTGIVLVIMACHTKKDSATEDLPSGMHKVTAEEVIQVNNYTYVKVKDNEQEYWLAINKTDVKKGETYYWSQGMPMKNFPSKELGRTFDLLYFVQDFSSQPGTAADDMPSSSWAGKPASPVEEQVSVEPAKGGVTIKDLYDQPEKYKGKTVMVRGKVVKYNAAIMNRNWIHIQDGTKSGDHFDLAITSSDQVRKGDVVLFKGVIDLNKDFGAGYFYDVIMEDATLLKADN